MSKRLDLIAQQTDELIQSIQKLRGVDAQLDAITTAMMHLSASVVGTRLGGQVVDASTEGIELPADEGGLLCLGIACFAQLAFLYDCD